MLETLGNRSAGLKVLLLSLCYFLLLPDTLHAAAWQKKPFIMNSFYEVALGSEYEKVPLIVNKWNKPVRIYVEHQVGDVSLHNQLLNAQINDLKKITGLDIRRVKSRKQANVYYYFTSQKRFPALVKKVSGQGVWANSRGAVCLASMNVDALGNVQQAAVYIPVDRARMQAKLVACVVEELTQILGLPRDSDQVYPSIFNDRTPNALLTGLDIILLQLLYHPKVKSGMGKPALAPVLSELIAEMQRNGMIKKAITGSRRSQLCQFVDC